MRKSPIIYSAVLLTIVNFVLRIVSTSFQVYISSKIGAEGIGLLQLVLSVGSLALIAGIAGIRTATMYLTAGELGRKHPENVSHILSGCLLYSFICAAMVAIILYFSAPFLAANWIGTPHSTKAIRMYSCFLPISCLCGVMIGYFTAANRIPTLAITEIAEQIVSMALILFLLNYWAKTDVNKACQAVIIGGGIGACLTLSVLTILRIRERAPKGAPFPLRKRLLDIAAPLALADDLKAGINTTENLMVPKRLALYPGTKAPLAIFGTVCGMVFPVLMFPAAIVFSLAELLIPEMARCHAAGNKLRIQYLCRKSLKLVLIYSLFFSGLLYLLAYPLCNFLYNNTQAGHYLSLYAFLAPMLYCDAIIDAMNKGLGQQKICVRYNILTAALDVIFLFILLPRYGMDGYFFSFVLTHLLNFLLSFRLLIKTTSIEPNYRFVFSMILFSSISVYLPAFVSNPLLRAGAFILIFGSLIVLFQKKRSPP